jgi:hypothetical protein
LSPFRIVWQLDGAAAGREVCRVASIPFEARVCRPLFFFVEIGYKLFARYTTSSDFGATAVLDEPETASDGKAAALGEELHPEENAAHLFHDEDENDEDQDWHVRHYQR